MKSHVESGQKPTDLLKSQKKQRKRHLLSNMGFNSDRILMHNWNFIQGWECKKQICFGIASRNKKLKRDTKQ